MASEQGFFKRWGDGIKNLSPAQQLHAKMVSHVGAFIGMMLALVVLFMRGGWYFSVFIFFIGIIQLIDYIGTRQRWLQAKEIESVAEQNKIEDEKQTALNELIDTAEKNFEELNQIDDLE